VQEKQEMNHDPAISHAVLEQAKSDCAKALYAKPFEGYMNQSKYMHTAGGETIVNLTKEGFSVYLLCSRRADNKVVIDQSQINKSAERRQNELRRHWDEGIAWGGAGPAFLVLVAALSSLLVHH
jgi:hypothetical protein